MIYISTLLMLCLFARAKGEKDKRLFELGVLLILVVTCLRSPNIGIDTAGGYLEDFNAVASGYHLGWLEPAWEPLNKLAIELGFGYQGVIAFAGVLAILPVAYVIRKISKNECYSLALYYGMYFVLYSYNLMRQMIAVSFALMAIYFYYEKKYKWTFFWLVLGVMFHKTILFVLPVFVFTRFRLKYSMTVIITLVSLLLGAFLPSEVFYVIAGHYAGNLAGTDGYSGFRTSILVPVVMAAILSVFFLFITYYGRRKLEGNMWYMMSLLGIIVMNLTVKMGQGTRMVFYFSQAQVLFIPEHLKNSEIPSNRRFVKAIYFIYLFMNFFRVLLNQWDTVTPYRFFWQV